MRVCATPATCNEGGCKVVPRLPRKMLSATPATRNEGRCEVIACERLRDWYVRKLCVKLLYVKSVCVKFLYVRDWYVKLLYVRDGM